MYSAWIEKLSWFDVGRFDWFNWFDVVGHIGQIVRPGWLVWNRFVEQAVLPDQAVRLRAVVDQVRKAGQPLVIVNNNQVLAPGVN